MKEKRSEGVMMFPCLKEKEAGFGARTLREGSKGGAKQTLMAVVEFGFSCKPTKATGSVRVRVCVYVLWCMCVCMSVCVCVCGVSIRV